MRRRLSGAASRAALRRGLRECGRGGWGTAGRLGGTTAAKVGEDGAYLRDFTRFAYLTGWRKGEII